MKPNLYRDRDICKCFNGSVGNWIGIDGKKNSYLLRVFDPLDLFPVRADILEALGVVDGEDEEESLARPHVLVSHGGVLLLARSVQDVQ